MKPRRTLVSVILVLMAFTSSLLLVISFARNIHLELELETWIKLAGKTQAIAAYQNKNVHFLLLEGDSPETLSTTVGTNFGIPVEKFPHNGEGTRKFISFYNDKMKQLIEGNSGVSTNR